MILGFRFASKYAKGEKGKYQLTVGEKELTRLRLSLILIAQTKCLMQTREPQPHLRLGIMNPYVWWSRLRRDK